MVSGLSYYRIGKKIGAGGTGEVYFAVDTRDEEPVAIKKLFIKSAQNEFIRKKFIQEANLYLYLDHPNIAELLDFIIDEDAYYLVTEYIPGFTLNEYFSKNPYIPDEKIIEIFMQVLVAIGYAHKQKVIHLDIKPSNIMITQNITDNDKHNIVKIIDFGIASTIDEDKTNEQFVGTPLYMSPEQIEQKSADHRSDIYSLGITLFQLITKQIPYYGTTTLEALMYKIINEPLPHIHSIDNTLNPIYDKIIKKATSKNPFDRFQSTEEFLGELMQILN
ncbi:MAG: serine/threonine protein kinase [Bacteroidales bacterium]|nr:serine/threonine protein kinase [Bacteroidales bacterium]